MQWHGCDTWVSPLPQAADACVYNRILKHVTLAFCRAAQPAVEQSLLATGLAPVEVFSGVVGHIWQGL